MALSPRVPQELLDKIVDDLHDDIKALGCCALTSRLLLSRSQTHMFSSIIISTRREAARHRSRMDANPRLWGYVHRLTFLVFFHVKSEGSGTDVSNILRKATSLQTLFVGSTYADISWDTIPEDIQNALFQAFCSPSLTTLHISYVSSLPASLFGLKVHLNHFFLKAQGLCDDLIDLGSADLSSMSAHTLEISSQGSDDQTLLSIIAHPNSFSCRVKKLILRNIGNTKSLAIPMIKAAMYSLETILILQYSSLQGCSMDLPGWAELNFNLMPYLRRLEMHFIMNIFSPETLHESAIAVVHKIVDYLTVNISVLRIKQINIRLVPWWLYTESFSPGWHHIMDTVCMVSHWSMLDEVLETRAISPEFNIAFELGMYKGNEGLEYGGLGSAAELQGEIHVVKRAWEEKIHARMPLASRGGVLTAKVIPDE